MAVRHQYKPDIRKYSLITYSNPCRHDVEHENWKNAVSFGHAKIHTSLFASHSFMYPACNSCRSSIGAVSASTTSFTSPGCAVIVHSDSWIVSHPLHSWLLA